MNSMCRSTESLPLVTECRAFRGLVVVLMVVASMFSGAAIAGDLVALDQINLMVPDILTNTDTRQMPTIDADGDGLLDAVVLGRGGESDAMRIFGFQPGTGWIIKQTLIPEQSDYSYGEPKIAAWVDSNGPHLLYMRGTKIDRYSGWPFLRDGSFQIEYSDIGDIAIADVDNNGSLELLLSDFDGEYRVRALSIETGAVLWAISASGSGSIPGLLVAQLDADPAKEIVVGNGTIYDGATHAIEWQYKDGFGMELQAGRFGGATPRFAGMGDLMVMFQSSPWSPLWDLDVGGFWLTDSATADIDGDEIDEVVLSDGFINAIAVVDVTTQSVRSWLPAPIAYQLAVADFDGDGQLEIAMASAGDPPEYFDGFGVIDATTAAVEREDARIAIGPYIAGAFVEEAGNLDLIFGSITSWAYPGTLSRVNALTGEVRWRSIENDPDGLAGISKLQVASIPGQQHPTIFAWGQGPSSESIVAFDSSSGEALWNISASSIPGNWQFTGLAAINLDADTLADAILTCTNSRLRLFDIADQSLIWTSVEMASYCVDVMPMTTGGSKQLVAVLGQMLRAYDAQTHLLSWSLPNAQGERQTRGASFLPQGVAGAEIAVFSEYAVTFFDAETRVSLRRYELGDYYKPINALAQPQGGSIHDLVITIGDRMHILNGATGELRATSAALGFDAGLFNQLAMHTNSDASYLIGVGTDVAVLTYQVNALTDTIFANGFEN